MSSLVVEVCQIEEVRPHPNADALELAVVRGYQCCVGLKDQWAVGDKCVFFPPDTILPPEWSDTLGVTQYLTKGRIRHVKLRGEPSFGLVVRPSLDWPAGMDVAALYGATKYEPPVRHVQGEARAPRKAIEGFRKYTDIENLRNFPHMFTIGEHVVITEKIHGANCRVGVINGKLVAGSHNMERERSYPSYDKDSYDSDTYWYPYNNFEGVRALLDPYVKPSWWNRIIRRQKWDRCDIILYGEVYGPKIQSFSYGVDKNSLGYAAFDIMINGQYQNFEDLCDICDQRYIPVVPLVSEGLYSLEDVAHYAVGDTLVGTGAHMREGVVVRPVQERRDPKYGRVIGKYLSDTYLLSKHSDFLDV
jgi:RNA ligase (TIGR02306 family)